MLEKWFKFVIFLIRPLLTILTQDCFFLQGELAVTEVFRSLITEAVTALSLLRYDSVSISHLDLRIYHHSSMQIFLNSIRLAWICSSRGCGVTAQGHLQGCPGATPVLSGSVQPEEDLSPVCLSMQLYAQCDAATSVHQHNPASPDATPLKQDKTFDSIFLQNFSIQCLAKVFLNFSTFCHLTATNLSLFYWDFMW